MAKVTKDDGVARLKAYFAGLDAGARREMKALRNAIRSVAPKAEEAFSYGIPAFKLDGKPLVYYASWKAHTSLYPITARTKAAVGDALDGFKTSKGTVQFPRTKPVPVALIKRLVKARLAELKSRP